MYNISVRQGENLSPKVLKSFISRKCDGLKDIENMQKEHLDEESVTYFKLHILLYVDDTVIPAENSNYLQALLYEMENYCNTFDLHINVNKTEVLLFSRGKLRKCQFLNLLNLYLILWINKIV